MRTFSWNWRTRDAIPGSSRSHGIPPITAPRRRETILPRLRATGPPVVAAQDHRPRGLLPASLVPWRTVAWRLALGSMLTTLVLFFAMILSFLVALMMALCDYDDPLRGFGRAMKAAGWFVIAVAFALSIAPK